MARRHCRPLCRWLVGLLLAVQWLVASHACPPAAGLAAQPASGPQSRLATPAAGPQWQAATPATFTGAAPARHAGLPDCHHAPSPVGDAVPAAADAARFDDAASSAADSAGSALCRTHCSADPQAPTQAAAGDAVPDAGGWWMAIDPAPPRLPVLQPRAPALGARAGAPPPGWPPLFLAHGVLRN
jgi:hypothetical protein